MTRSFFLLNARKMAAFRSPWVARCNHRKWMTWPFRQPVAVSLSSDNSAPLLLELPISRWKWCFPTTHSHCCSFLLGSQYDTLPQLPTDLLGFWVGPRCLNGTIAGKCNIRLILLTLDFSFAWDFSKHFRQRSGKNNIRSINARHVYEIKSKQDRNNINIFDILTVVENAFTSVVTNTRLYCHRWLFVDRYLFTLVILVHRKRHSNWNVVFR